MSDLSKDISNLTPEKRALLELLLSEEGIKVEDSLIIPQKRVFDEELDGFRMPLSFAQQRLWFLDQFEIERSLYNIPLAMKLIGNLDLVVLKSCIEEIIRRHESLRTTFKVVGDQPYQVISSDTEFNLQVVELNDTSEDDLEEAIAGYLIAEARKPFDLEHGPLFRVVLMKLSVDHHIVLFNMHHIISDGWSMGVLIREFVQLYEAFQGNSSSPLAELSVQYADYSIWQQNWLNGEVYENQLDYWVRQLGQDQPVLALPTDFPRPAVKMGRGESYKFDFDGDLSEAVRNLSTRFGTTLFVTLLAMFATLLHRYTGQMDIRLGTPIAGRNRRELEDLIGFFVNTLVLRADFKDNPSFSEILQRIKAASVDAYSNQDLPFEYLVEALHPERDMSHPPLFQVMFALQNAPKVVWNLPGLMVENIPVHSLTSKFDLSLILTEVDIPGSDYRISGLLEFDTDLFGKSSIEKMVGHLENLLGEIVANPELPVSELAIMSEDELVQITEDWNWKNVDYKAIEYAQHQTIKGLFEKQVRISPSSIAVVSDGKSISYQEINKLANKLADFLINETGVGPEILVGLCVERSIDSITGILGILKAGGAYLPLDPSYPVERISYILQDANANILITQKNIHTKLSSETNTSLFSDESNNFVLCMDDEWDDKIAQRSEDDPSVQLSPVNLAYVIYTSGSTGQPKGVMIDHQSVINLFNGLSKGIYTDRASASANENQFGLRISLNAPLLFDASVQQWIMLLGGHSIYVVPQDVRLDGEGLLKFIREHRIDLLDCVPTQLKMLLEAGLLSESDWTPQIVLPGGEAIDETMWEMLSGSTGTDFYNMYGPTECTVDATYSHINRYPRQPVIGRPLSNNTAYILDMNMEPVPPGVPGELFIGGMGVGRGYFNQPEMTAERFIPNPFSRSDVNNINLDYKVSLDNRLYKTGDKARYLVDGQIEYLGRMDFQVKVRGFRIELGEIEAVLNQHPDVSDSVAWVWEDDGIKWLVGYFVPEDRDNPPTIIEMREYLSNHLPDYMVPSIFLALDKVPLTPNGKVDRKALPDPVMTRDALGMEFSEPGTPEEKLLAQVWSEVLGIQGDMGIGVHDNFFDLGGHSLLATKVLTRTRRAFDIDIPLRALFDSPTIAQFARRIEEIRSKENVLSVNKIEPVPRDGDLRLSFGQQRLWFIDQLDPGSALYNMPEAIRVRGNLDIEALEHSLNEIIRRHEVMRTSYITVDGKPFIKIEPEIHISLPVVDLSKLAGEDREQELIARIANESQLPFDLSQAPLFRISVLKLSDEDNVVLFTLHHIITDGWSTNVLINELTFFYPRYAGGMMVEDARSILPELSIQYIDYASWQRNWLAGDVLDEQLGYWKEQLSGLPPLLELPTDRPRPPVQSANGNQITFQIPAEFFYRMQSISLENEATLFMTMLATFQAFLNRYTRHDDIPVGTPVANRNHPDIGELIGFFVNTLVIRADFSDDPSFIDLIAQIKEVALQAYAHQDVPFEMLVDHLQPNRDLSYSPLFQVMFMFQNVTREDVHLEGIRLERMDINSRISKFDLTMVISEGEDSFYGGIEYNTDLFDQSTIDRMIENYLIFIDNIVRSPDKKLSELELISSEEYKKIVFHWNQTRMLPMENTFVHQLFEKQVEASPDAIAIRMRQPDNDRILTYRDLNQRANEIAYYLQSRGVKPDTIIGLCVERSEEMVAGILGILKADGAYLPIDATYPMDRIKFMLQDSGVNIVLTQDHLANVLPRNNDKIEIISLDQNLIENFNRTDNPESRISPDNLAYVIYTSGSTGLPKGAMILHRGLSNYLNWVETAYPLTEGIGAPIHSSISFDLTVTGLFGPLISGGLVDLLPERSGVESLGELLQKDSTEGLSPYSLIKITPAHLQVLGNQMSGNYSVEKTRSFIIGGENLMNDHIEFWQSLYPETILVNEYGPTETVVGCCVYFADPEKENPWGVVPIGRPIINTQLYVLDDNLQPVPVGVTGELYVSGEGVSRGYLKRPGLTAERYVPNPFLLSSDEDQALLMGSSRLYRTGDLARYLPDGNIECLGRSDFQMKIRGYRVEIGEIEAVLGEHQDIREAAVWVGERSGTRHLIGYYVPDNLADPPDLSEIKEYLHAFLPNYMIPTYFVQLDSLPLTPNGKVDRDALPDPELTRESLDSQFIAPRSPEEMLFAQIWAEVLGYSEIEQIGVNDNFFELGGDSILTVQVIAKANQHGLHLTPRQMFEYPTISQLAREARHGIAVVAEQGLVEGEVLLTPIQRWFFEQNISNRDHYNQTLLFEIDQKIDICALETAVKKLIHHHDALRLRYVINDDRIRQVNLGYDEASIVKESFMRVDMEKIPDKDISAEITKNAEKIQASLNIQDGPMIRFVIFDLGDHRPNRIIIAAHHLVIDGISWRILLEDLQAVYQQVIAGVKTSLPEKTTSFQKWSERLNELAISDDLLDELSFWLGYTKKEVFELPVDHPDGENLEHMSAITSVSLSEDETRALLQDVHGAYHTEINDILLSALVLSLADLSGYNNILINMEGHGREDLFDDVDVSRTVGWFTSMFPVQLRIGSHRDIGETIKSVKEQLRSIPGNGIGYGLLKYLAGESIRNKMDEIPRPQISFNYLGQFDQVLPEATLLRLATEARGPDRDGNGTRSVLLDVTAGVLNRRLTLEWNFSTGIFDLDTIGGLAENYLFRLRAIIDHCTTPQVEGFTPSDFPLADLDQKDLDKLLGKIKK